MENPNDSKHPNGCKCNGCGWPNVGKMCGHGCCQHNWLYHALRWFFGIVILVIVFCVGVQVGVIKGSLQSGNGYRSYNRSARYGMEYGRPMMYGNTGDYRVVNGGPAVMPGVQSGAVSPAPQQKVTAQ